MPWVRLAGLKNPCLGRGVRFRFPAKHPFESVVEFTTINLPQVETGWALIATTGYHAGRVELVMPHESLYLREGWAPQIDTAWLIKNWRKWVYDISPAKVMVNTRSQRIHRLPESR